MTIKELRQMKGLTLAAGCDQGSVWGGFGKHALSFGGRAGTR